MSTLEGIKKSRQNFEELPDNALFGKNVARIFNYIECYLFRFLFVGIFLILGLNQIYNALVILILFFIGVFSIPIMLVILIIGEIWRFLFFDFYFQNKYTWDYGGYKLDLKYRKNKLGILLSRCTYFPIIQLIFKMFAYFFIQLGHVFFLTFFYPFLTMLIGIFGFLRYSLRLLYDNFFFYVIIKPLAKIPERDTNLARKISGPGISKNLFYSLKIEDTVQLALAELEKIRLEYFKTLVCEYLNEDHLKLMKVVQNITSPFFNNGSLQKNQM